MSYKTTRTGIGDWADLIGKTISFRWCDGWDDYFFEDVLTGTRPQEMDDPRYPKYYLLLDHGGVGFSETEPVTVTVWDEENE